MGWGLTCAFLRLFLAVARVQDSPIPSPLLVMAVPSRLRGLGGAVVGDVAVATGARRGCCRNGWAVVAVERVGGGSKTRGRFENGGAARTRVGGGLGIDAGRGFRRASSALLGLVNPSDVALSG
jgi:hypothetical protein